MCFNKSYVRKQYNCIPVFISIQMKNLEPSIITKTKFSLRSICIRCLKKKCLTFSLHSNNARGTPDVPHPIRIYVVCYNRRIQHQFYHEYKRHYFPPFRTHLQRILLVPSALQPFSVLV